MWDMGYQYLSVSWNCLSEMKKKTKNLKRNKTTERCNICMLSVAPKEKLNALFSAIMVIVLWPADEDGSGSLMTHFLTFVMFKAHWRQ